MSYNTLTVDSTNLFTAYGVYVSGTGTYKSAARTFTMYSIPYRDGMLLGPESHFENVDIVYHCGIVNNFETNIAGLRDFLLSRNGYVKISDSYHTDEYRKGLYTGPFEPVVQPKLDGAEFDLVFNCLPQRWLTSGDTAVSIQTSSASRIDNPTKQNAKPLIKISGNSGTIRIGSWQIAVSSELNTTTYPNVYVDCDKMEAVSSTGVNLNKYVSVTLAGGGAAVDYPVLKSGSNILYRTGSITAAEITPRWWRA